MISFDENSETGDIYIAKTETLAHCNMDSGFFMQKLGVEIIG